MEITSVKFIKSSPHYESCPPEGPAEYAFAGRSNVGKSSLLNMLMNMRNLAKTSSKPGKTRLINHFLVNENWYLVDLPGYGFAKAGKTERDAFLKIISDYVLNRKTLACLFILIDSRHKPMENDLEFINAAGSAGIPLALVFTKTDKLGTTVLRRNIDVYKNTLRQTWDELPPVFLTSSEEFSGRKEILDFIGSANKKYAALPSK